MGCTVAGKLEPRSLGRLHSPAMRSSVDLANRIAEHQPANVVPLERVDQQPVRSFPLRLQQASLAAEPPAVRAFGRELSWLAYLAVQQPPLLVSAACQVGPEPVDSTALDSTGQPVAASAVRAIVALLQHSLEC